MFPEDAEIEFTSASEAKTASLRTRPPWDQAVRDLAALIALNPFTSSKGAASLALTSSLSCFSLVLRCSLSSPMCLANRTASDD